MKRSVDIAIILFCFFTLMITNPLSSSASEVIPFEISPVIPDRQNVGVRGYYDINVNPNEIIVLSVDVKNNLDKPLIVNITPFNATTSTSGDIVYDVNHKKEQFVNLKVPLQQVGESKNGVEIAAESTARIPIEFKLPKEEKGVVIGGIHVIADDASFSENVVQNEDATFKINNQIAYIIGVKMQFPIKVPPEFSFGKARVEMFQGKPRLLIEMKNAAPAVVKELSGTYAVKDEDGNPVLKGSFLDIIMAPNTRFEYPVNWTDGKLKPGEYTVDLTAELEGKNITAKKKFVIEETKPVKEYNKVTEETKVDSSNPWWNYLITAAVAGFIFFIVGRRTKKDKSKKS